MAIQHVHFTIKNAFGQDVAAFTVPVEWARAELEAVLPDGLQFRQPVPVPPGSAADPRAAWSVDVRCGIPEPGNGQ